MSRPNNVSVRIVGFLRESGGIREININKFVNESRGFNYNGVYNTLRRLQENRVLTPVDNKEHVYFLNEKFISVAEKVTEYLSKYPDGAAIDNSAFSRNNGVVQPLLVLVIQNFCDLGVIKVVEDRVKYRFNSTNYKLLVENKDDWRSLFEPKMNIADSENGTSKHDDFLTVSEKLINFIKLKGGCIEEGTSALAEILGCTKSGILYAVYSLGKYKKIVIKQRTRLGDKFSKGIYALPDYVENNEVVVEKPLNAEPLEVQLNKALKDKIQAQEQ